MGDEDDYRLDPYLAQLLQGLGIGAAFGVVLLSAPAAYKEVIAGLLFSRDPFGVFLGILLYVLISIVVFVAIARAARALKTEISLLREAPKPPLKAVTPEEAWKVPQVQLQEPKPKEKRRKEAK